MLRTPDVQKNHSKAHNTLELNICVDIEITDVSEIRSKNVSCHVYKNKQAVKIIIIQRSHYFTKGYYTNKDVPLQHILICMIIKIFAYFTYSATLTVARRLNEIGDSSSTPPLPLVVMLSRLTPILTSSLATVLARSSDNHWL